MTYLQINRHPLVSIGFCVKDFLGLKSRFLSFLSLSEKPVDSGGFLPVDSGGWIFQLIPVDSGGLADFAITFLLSVIGCPAHLPYGLRASGFRLYLNYSVARAYAP